MIGADVNSAKPVAFQAGRDDGTAGLYAVRQTGGRIKKIIAKDDSINGFTVSGFGIGRGVLSASASGTTLVIRVWYAGGGSGMYSTEIVF